MHFTCVRSALQGSRLGSLKPSFHIVGAFFFAIKSFYCDKALNLTVKYSVYVLQNVLENACQDKIFTVYLQKHSICKEYVVFL